MRKIRIMELMSLDGVISPGRRGEDSDFAHGGWTAPYRSAAGAEAVAEAQGCSFDLLLGRRTYDLWADYWPKITSGPFAKGLNAATKYVATHRPDSLGWGPVGDLRGHHGGCSPRQVEGRPRPDRLGKFDADVRAARAGTGRRGLLLVYPVLLGLGKRFLSDSADPRELALVSSKATPSGVLMNTYRYVRSLRTESAHAST